MPRQGQAKQKQKARPEYKRNIQRAQDVYTAHELWGVNQKVVDIQSNRQESSL